MPVNVRSRSFPATIRETSSLRNQPLCHRGSNNDGDHGLSGYNSGRLYRRLQSVLRSALQNSLQLAQPAQALRVSASREPVAGIKYYTALVTARPCDPD